MTDRWRLVPLQRLAGPSNMAIDEALLTLVGEGATPPTLRIYEWDSPWLSLGSAQSAGDLDREALAARGWGLLRRASGGTAVLHAGQIGFAAILPSNHPLWQGDLVSSYERFSLPITRAFARLGVDGDAAPPSLKAAFSAGAPASAGRACFSALGPYEFLDRQGRKLIGNSQIRRRASSLFHGAIQIRGGQSALVRVLARLSADEQDDVESYLSSHVGSLEEVAGREIRPCEVAEALVAAFAETLDLCLNPIPLAPCECHLADELMRTKYQADEWTFRR